MSRVDTNAPATVGGLTRHRSPDDPELPEARRALAAASRADHHARQFAETFPPLSESQRTRLRAILRGIGGDHGA